MEQSVTGTTLPEFEGIEADGKTLMRSYGSLCVKLRYWRSNKGSFANNKRIDFLGRWISWGKKSLSKIKSFCFFLSYKLISKYLHFKLTIFFLQSY